MHNKIVTLTLLYFMSSVSFADVSVRPRAGFSYDKYDMQISSGSKLTSSSSYLTVDLGLTVLYDRIYYDVAYKSSFNASHDFTTTGNDESFKRQDFALAAGYLFQDHWSVFAGYKYGDSEFSNYILGASPYTNLNFETKGLFSGLSKVFIFGKNALSVNVALAFLDGKLTDTDTLSAPLNASADTVGASVGVAYSLLVEKNMGLVVKLSYQNYEFSNLNDPIYIISDVSENILNFGVSFFSNF